MRTALANGILGGAAFATVECAIEWIATRFASPLAVAAVKPAMLLAPFAVYPIVVGVACALLALVSPTRLRPMLPGIALTASFLAIALPSVGPASFKGLIAIGTFLGLAAIATTINGQLAERLRGVLNAWGVSLLLLVPIAVAHEWLVTSPARQRWTISAACAVASLAVGVAFDRMRWERRRRTLATVATASLVIVVALATNRDHLRLPAVKGTGANATLPNVIIITLDTVRADHLPLYGYDRDTAPNLTAFAKTSTLFATAIAPSNYTLPSHTSMFTGLYASAHGNNQEVTGRILSPAIATLAETLARGGYRTFSVVANGAFLGTAFSLDRGFRYLDARTPSVHLPRVRLWSRSAAGARYRRAGEIADQAAIVVRSQAAERVPFFLFVNFLDAHSPYESPPPFRDRFPGRNPRWAVEPLIDRLLAEGKTDGVRASNAERAHLISQYDGSIAYIDAVLPRLLDALRSTGKFDNTLIVVTSDHGEGFGDKGLLLHGNSLYQELIHVPLLVKWPHQTRASSRRDVVSLNDIYPTVLEAVQRRAPHAPQAVSLASPPGAGRVVLSEGFVSAFTTESTKMNAAIGDRYKLLVDGGRRVYDLVTDPNETAPLAHVEGPELARLRNGVAALATMRPPAAGTRKLDSETIRRLRALGYLR